MSQVMSRRGWLRRITGGLLGVFAARPAPAGPLMLPVAPRAQARPPKPPGWYVTENDSASGGIVRVPSRGPQTEYGEDASGRVWLDQRADTASVFHHERRAES
jgi:hypothetical protein